MSQTVFEQLEQATQRVERAKVRCNAIQAKLEASRQLYAEALKESQALVDARREKKHHPDLLVPGVKASLDVLRTIIQRDEAENTAAVAEYVRAVDAYEAGIARIEKALSDPEAMNELLLTITPVASAAPAPAEAAVSASGQAAVQFNEDDI
jgi:CHASE3 domain sensor protein